METFALYFNIIVQFAGVLYLSFAFVLCLFKTPKRERYKTYRRSQRFLALNYLVMGTNCLAWCFVRPDVWWLTLDPIVEIMDTSLFLLAAIFLTFFFGNLLGTVKASTRHLTLSLALWLLNTLLSISSLWMDPSLAGPLVRRVSVMVYFIYIFYFMFRLLKVYKHRDRMLDQYFTRDMHQFVHWIYRSILLMLFLGAVAAFTLTLGVVGNIISEIAPYLGIATDGVDRSGTTVKVPNLTGKEWSNAQVQLNIKGLKHHLAESESDQTAALVTYQYPRAGAEVPYGTTVYLYTDTYEGKHAEVPDVTGKSADFARQMLNAAGLNCTVEGSGTVQSQSEAPGSSVQQGTIVHLICG